MQKERVCLIGLEQPEYEYFREHLNMPLMHHVVVPKILVTGGQLFVQRRSGAGMLPVTKVIYHGIFEDELDVLAGLALWGGDCFPNAHAMMDCRLKLPCLVRALRYTDFGAPSRGFASPGTSVVPTQEMVAKWGNWHCGENKMRFAAAQTLEEPSIIEPFIPGESVRIVLIGDQYWQIKLEGTDWLKSIHDDRADYMPVDPLLLADTRKIAAGFGLEMVGVDYIVTPEGTRHMLEVNHIPNVTRFPEIRDAFLAHSLAWIEGKS